jgi:crossover junction endodeoxyribonuclease RuvC
MLILGLDPGSRITGWGVVRQDGPRTVHVASGVLRLDSEAELPERLADLTARLEAVLAQHRPQQVALEQIFYAKNARSALVLGHARGAILATVARAGVPVFEYTPAQVKQAVSGSGRAEKGQVQRMVAVLLNHRAAMTEDESDALAVALTHGATQQRGSSRRPGGAYLAAVASALAQAAGVRFPAERKVRAARRRPPAIRR